MGYTSNIEVLCGAKAYQKLHSVMSQHGWHPDSISKVPDHDVYFFELCCYKWYDNYDDVQEFMSVLEYCDIYSDDPQYYYSFIRLGEEQSDVEILNNHDYSFPYCDHCVYTATDRPGLEPIDELI